MKTTTFTGLTEKQVANCRNGRIIGQVVDIKIDTECGKILSLLVCEGARIPLFAKPNITEIFWDRIEKIGDDLIIVDTDHFPAIPDKPKKEKKYFFGS